MLNLALAQINTTAGDWRGNLELIKTAIGRAEAQGGDLVVFPEMALTGYPADDLLAGKEFVDANLAALDQVCALRAGIAALVGFAERGGERLYNAAALIANGEVQAVYRKIILANYSVFDELRYFSAGSELLVFELKGVRCGVCVCADFWHSPSIADAYAPHDIDVLINASASPFEARKFDMRRELLTTAAKKHNYFAALVNQVGGQDELLFDGGSMVISPQGAAVLKCKRFESDLRHIAVAPHRAAARANPPSRALKVARHPFGPAPLTSPRFSALAQNQLTAGSESEIYRALTLATRDFAQKCGFARLGVAVSGGIDSALTLAIAADAVGAPNVTAVYMPSRYSSDSSRAAAELICKNLGVELLTIPIDSFHAQTAASIQAASGRAVEGVADENMQARLRAVVMMTLANREGFLTLATGNKSELATGYATVYGDMVGGWAPLKDVLKTAVYQIARWLNQTRQSDIIPPGVIAKAPTAELRPNQFDADALPPYDQLDIVLSEYINLRRGADEIAARPELTLTKSEIRRVIALVDAAEHKRRVSAPGPKISSLAFGKDRRLPLAVNRSDGGAQ